MSPLLVLIGAVLATTYAGRIVRLVTAPALAIAFWRLTLTLPVTGFLALRGGALAAGPMLIGHTGMNYALRYFRATTVNVAALGEPVGATLLAWVLPAIHEVPRAMALIGGMTVLTGISLSLGAGQGRDQRHAS